MELSSPMGRTPAATASAATLSTWRPLPGKSRRRVVRLAAVTESRSSRMARKVMRSTYRKTWLCAALASSSVPQPGMVRGIPAISSAFQRVTTTLSKIGLPNSCSISSTTRAAARFVHTTAMHSARTHPVRLAIVGLEPPGWPACWRSDRENRLPLPPSGEVVGCLLQLVQRLCSGDCGWI